MLVGQTDVAFIVTLTVVVTIAVVAVSLARLGQVVAGGGMLSPSEERPSDAGVNKTTQTGDESPASASAASKRRVSFREH